MSGDQGAGTKPYSPDAVQSSQPIAFFKRQRDALDRVWHERCRAKRWDKTDPTNDPPEEAAERLKANLEQANRRIALVSKHFPRINLLDIRSVDSKAALWAYIIFGIEQSGLAEHIAGPRVHAKNLRPVYKVMHSLGIAWAPDPPYASLPEDQAVDKLYAIANRLEQEEAITASAVPQRDTGEATPTAKRHVPGNKRSTAKGEAREKIVAALTTHHQYADGGALNHEPIGNNQLAELAKVDKASASGFFKAHFGGHGKYKTLCHRNFSRVLQALKALNNEFTVEDTYGSGPPEPRLDGRPRNRTGNRDRDDDE
jgi:hypothetical protein